MDIYYKRHLNKFAEEFKISLFKVNTFKMY